MLALYNYYNQLYVEQMVDQTSTDRQVIINPLSVSTREKRVMYSLTPSAYDRVLKLEDSIPLIQREWVEGSKVLDEDSFNSYLRSYLNGSLTFVIPKEWYIYLCNSLNVECELLDTL